jgi:hypothetical protein
MCKPIDGDWRQAPFAYAFNVVSGGLERARLGSITCQAGLILVAPSRVKVDHQRDLRQV